ncbi:Nse4 C-terminal-domain-containing protein [Cryomyces antarcticus]
MARLNAAASETSSRASSLYRDPTPMSSRQPPAYSSTYGTLSPSPSGSQGSDKENQTGPSSRTASDTGEGRMGPPKLPTPTSESATTPRMNKRRRTGERAMTPSRAMSEASRGERTEDQKWYDPDQPEEERREAKRESRHIERKFQENRDEYLRSDNRGLIKTIEEANRVFKRIKQTADATIDSRLLVNVGDVTYKKSTLLALGNNSTGIDVDEFVSKCITFMRRGAAGEDGVVATAANRRRQRRNSHDSDDEDADGNQGDALNWEWLGQRACFPHNLRPPVSGFLLGPLSVQKRARTQTQRRARQTRGADAPVSRPEVLTVADLEQTEKSSLTVVCTRIRNRLVNHIESAKADFDEDMSEQEQAEFAKERRIADDGGVSLFDFTINPESFGQTIENLFYVSFLIKEGSVSVEKDSNGLPTLHPSESRSLDEQRAQKVRKHQAVFSLDWPTWEKLIAAFNITEPLIPNRDDGQSTQVNARGWYG